MQRPFKVGDIVKRHTGHTPMRIMEVPESDDGLYVADYCRTDVEMIGSHYRRHQICLVDAPARQLAGCRDWTGRLAEEDRAALMRQLKPGAEPLPWGDETHTQGGNTMADLYQTKENPPRFGTKIAVDSSNRIVLEMKGTGAVEAFRRNQLEEVRPYTVGVRFFDGNGTEYAYISTEGAVQVGDVLMITGSASLARVTAVNTKSPKATTFLTGRKVVTAEIPGLEDAPSTGAVVEDVKP